MAKLSASALRSAAASAREKNVENTILNPTMDEVVEKKKDTSTSSSRVTTSKEDNKAEVLAESADKTAKNEHRPSVKTVLKSYESERKTEHVNLLITQTLSRKIELIQEQGEFRSKNAAVIAVLEAFCDANGIE